MHSNRDVAIVLVERLSTLNSHPRSNYELSLNKLLLHTGLSSYTFITLNKVFEFQILYLKKKGLLFRLSLFRVQFRGKESFSMV